MWRRPKPVKNTAKRQKTDDDEGKCKGGKADKKNERKRVSGAGLKAVAEMLPLDVDMAVTGTVNGGERPTTVQDIIIKFVFRLAYCLVC
jgi:hypothetical protein